VSGNGGERWRTPFIHEDRRFVSIGREDSGDTLLRLPDKAHAYGDHEVAVEWFRHAASLEAVLAENERLKDALGFYADKGMYLSDGIHDYIGVLADQGDRARAVLSEEVS